MYLDPRFSSSLFTLKDRVALGRQVRIAVGPLAGLVGTVVEYRSLPRDLVIATSLPGVYAIVDPSDVELIDPVR